MSFLPALTARAECDKLDTNVDSLPKREQGAIGSLSGAVEATSFGSSEICL